MLSVFISSNRAEFIEERKFIKEKIEEDEHLKKIFEIFVFEEDSAKTIPAAEHFINKAAEADIYIGLIGKTYGKIYKNGLSSTEYEYNVYDSNKNNSYFFIKEVDNEMDREKESREFIERISKKTTWKSFKTKERLLELVKEALEDYLNAIFSNKRFDKTLIRKSTCDDVDEESLHLFFDCLKDESFKRLKEEREYDKILEYIGAGEIDNDGQFHLNNTGALFFAKDIDKFNIDHDVKMVRFNGNDRLDIIDSQTSKNSFFKIIKEFEIFFKKNTRLGSVFEGFKRIDIPEYPINAVREALVNALAHRDYNMWGHCITFYIYDDRIEIISPGALIYPLTVDNLGINLNPIHRNEAICNIFAKTIYMEHFGTGIKRMRNEMQRSGLKDPEFYNENNFFTVILRGPNGKLIKPNDLENYETLDLNDYDLNERQIELLNNMNKKDMVYTYNSYAEEFNISYSTSKRDLNKLIEYNLIKKGSIGRTNIFYV